VTESHSCFRSHQMTAVAAGFPRWHRKIRCREYNRWN